jgi:hypothetical protein
LQRHPHDAALVNAHSFVSMGVEAMCCPCHSATHCQHMKRQPSLCHCHPCHDHRHCNCRSHLRCLHDSVAVTVTHCRCRCRHRRPLLLWLPSTIAAAVSVVLPSDIAVVVAIAVVLAVGHFHLRQHRPLQLPSPLAITIACCLGATRIVFKPFKQRMLTLFYFVRTVGGALIKAG